MIANQIIQTSIDELRNITKIDLCVMDLDGMLLAATFDTEEIQTQVVQAFAESAADSQVIKGYHFFKVYDERQLENILVTKGDSEAAYMIGKVAVSQLQNLIIAYKERYDKNNFIQNLILDNLLLVDIYNRAKKLKIPIEARRIVYMIETKYEKDNNALETLKSMFSNRNGDFVTAVDEKSIILVKELKEGEEQVELDAIANTLVDMLNTEAMTQARVSYGTIVNEIKEISKSYKEAKMALDVGKIFYSEKNVVGYSSLGIGRLIYQLPMSLCEMFMNEVFQDTTPDSFDDETLVTINKFFENNLNVSETSRQLFVHRNTLVYRLEKLQKSTGLDIRVFDDALTFKIALMVVNYMKYMRNLDY
ncbi:MAG: helix-turn-helix domain-containing protein [Lachnospiraceae bacterium]|nr:helix-turn-helix domain-containing protein [Lachnospiraceae bacterium]